MKQIKVMMLILATCLAGCSSDDGGQQQKQEAPRPMIVDVSAKSSVGEQAAAPMAMNRTAAYTTTATLSSFAMHYMGNRYQFVKTGDTWSTNSWPSGVGNNQKIDFYADTYSYNDTHSASYNYNDGNPYVTFTVEETAANQHDLLVAEHKLISYNDAGGHVSLLFDHACAIVCFNVYLSETLSTQLGGSLQVNSIVLRNVNNQGDYYYASKSWSNVSGTAYYTLTNGEMTVTTTSQPLSCGYLFMIPQQREKNGTEGTHLEINYTHNGAKQATIPLTINWSAGKLYTININLGTAVITLS